APYTLRALVFFSRSVHPRDLHSFPTRRSSDLAREGKPATGRIELRAIPRGRLVEIVVADDGRGVSPEVLEQAQSEGSLAELLARSEEHTSELQSRFDLVCRLLLEKKKKRKDMD